MRVLDPKHLIRPNPRHYVPTRRPHLLHLEHSTAAHPQLPTFYEIVTVTVPLFVVLHLYLVELRLYYEPIVMCIT